MFQVFGLDGAVESFVHYYGPFSVCFFYLYALSRSLAFVIAARSVTASRQTAVKGWVGWGNSESTCFARILRTFVRIGEGDARPIYPIYTYIPTYTLIHSYECCTCVARASCCVDCFADYATIPPSTSSSGRFLFCFGTTTTTTLLAVYLIISGDGTQHLKQSARTGASFGPCHTWARTRVTGFVQLRTPIRIWAATTT